MKNLSILCLLLLSAFANASEQKSIMKFNFPPSCKFDKELQSKKSAELQSLMKIDQDDRKDQNKKDFKPDVNLPISDRERRKQVAAIFAEGCINSAEDYYAAAMVFQHGEVPDHYYQAYLWADKSAKLGMKDSRQLAAMAFDRYLVSTGKKQLFATQFEMVDMSKQCYCMAPVEEKLSEVERVRYAHVSMAEKYKQLEKLNSGKGCKPVQECDMKLQSVDKNEFPRAW